MGTVMTVLGPVDASELGIVLPHEHLLIDTRESLFAPVAGTASLRGLDQEQPLTLANRWAVRRDPRALRDNLALDDHVLAARELLRFKDAGGGGLADVSSTGIRVPGHAERLRWISEQTGVHIVAGCGFYQQISLPEYIKNCTEAQLAEYMLIDLTQGIQGSNVRAGVIGEIGTGKVDDFEERLLKASALAYKETGVPITIHTTFNCFEGRRIVEILECRSPPEAIIMGHMDENMVVVDPEPRFLWNYLLDIAQTGVWIQFDTFGSEWYYDIGGIQEPRDTERVAGIVKLIKEGFENQLLLSLDIWTKQCLSEYGGWGYDHLIRSVVPMMKNAGISEELIQKMLVDNPARALSIKEAS